MSPSLDRLGAIAVTKSSYDIEIDGYIQDDKNQSYLHIGALIRAKIERAGDFCSQILLVELRKDMPIHLATLLYLFSSVLLFSLSGELSWFAPTAYILPWIKSAALGILIYLLAVEIPISALRRSQRPLTDAVVRLWAHIQYRAFPVVLLIFSLSIFYGVFTSNKNMLPILSPTWRDESIANFNQSLHLGYLPWKLVHSVTGYHPVTRVIEFLYLPIWLLILVGFPVFLGARRDLASLRVRYVLTMFLCFIVLGNFMAALGMSGGPAFYAKVTGDHERYKDLIDYLTFSHGMPFSAWDIQQYLWACFEAKTPQLGSGISAFPSLHVSMATLFALAGRHLSLWLGRMLMLYGVVIFIGSIHLGWHYAVDGYASVIGTVLLWSLVGRATKTVQVMPTSSLRRNP